jgi:uncharacterized membrane protein HdeD (DUF308 family)
MAETGNVKPGLGRRLVGTPRIWVGVLWCCIGVAWLLLAAFGAPDPFDGGNVARLVLGLLWLALGVVQAVVALTDRKHERGFYKVAAPGRTAEPEIEPD